MKKRAVFALLIVALALLPVVAWADGICPCPENTELVAKFEWNGSAYVFEKPDGNEDLVTIAGNETGGTWTSAVPIVAVFIKGSTDCHTYSYDPTATSGGFSKEDLPLNPGGQRPDISNIQFCEPKPTAVALGSFSAHASGVHNATKSKGLAWAALLLSLAALGLGLLMTVVKLIRHWSPW